MSSRWVCISCGGADVCELLTEYDEEPKLCPYSDFPDLGTR